MRPPHRWLRVTLVALGAVIAGNLLILGFRGVAGANDGPPSSSFTTGPAGTAAYAELLAASGHRVERSRAYLEDATLDPSTTVVLLDPPPLGAPAARNLRRFVSAGGRLLAGGARPEAWLGPLLDEPPRWVSLGVRRSEVSLAVGEVAGVEEVEARGAGSWTDPGGGVAVLGSPVRALLVVRSVGSGRVALLSDTSVLHNHLLDRADNAALGLALAGRRARPVLFVESIHGYGPATGLGALPTAWRWPLGGFVLASLVWMWAHARRLGPPEDTGEEDAPTRMEHVHALAALLARTRSPAAALAPAQAAGRAEVLRRTGVRDDAPDAEVAQAATGLGLSRAESDALLSPVRDEDQAALLGRTLARLAPRGRAGRTGMGSR